MIYAKDFGKFVKSATEKVKADMEVTLQTVATDALTSLRTRSITQGISYQGRENQRVPYSRRNVRATYFYSQILNPGGRAYLKGKRYANWYQFRLAQGLTNTNVNFYYTGQFWNDHIYRKLSGKHSGVYRGNPRKFKELTLKFGPYYAFFPSDYNNFFNKVQNSFSKSCLNRF